MRRHLPKQALANLREVQDELIFTADALLAASVGPWEIHRNGEELYLSNQWLVVFGNKATSMPLRDYIKLFESNDQDKFIDQVDAAFQLGVRTTVEFHHKLAGRLVLSRGRVVEQGRMVGADILL